MDDNLFLDHLIQSLNSAKENAIKQYGKSDIEPPSYIEDVKEWYKVVFEKISDKPPCDYVKIITVFENSDQQIADVEYDYFGEDEVVRNTTINIFGV